MSRRIRWAMGIAAAGALLIPASALAVFPGFNGPIELVQATDAGATQADVYVIDNPLDTTKGTALDLIAGQHRHPAWSPEATFLVYTVRIQNVATCAANGVDPGPDEDIVRHETAGGTAYLLAELSGDCVLEDHPTVSADSADIAYESEVTNGSNQKDILIGPADGTGTVTNFTNTATAVEETPVYSADGKWLYYAYKPSAASTDSDIVRRRTDGSGVQESITQAAANEFQPELSPDGTKVCYTRGPFGSNAADVMVEDVAFGDTPIEINPTDPDAGMTAVADYDCGWSPDGTTIAYTRGAFSTGQLQFVPSSGGTSTPWGGNLGGAFDGNVDWSRDATRKCHGEIATVPGTPGKDDLSGTPGDDVALLLGGGDTFSGKGGDDIACGGAGNDTLKGGAGRDHLFGGVGRDNLQGGVKKDECVGGPGKDKAKSCEVKKSI